MVKNLTDRITRFSDQMLGKVVPKAKADAACGAYVYCCGWNGVSWELGQWRRDVEHGGECTPCYALNRPC